MGRAVKGPRARRTGIGAGIAAFVAALSLAASAAPAGAVTVGETGDPTGIFCAFPVDRVQPTVTSGSSYASTVNGTITSWSTQGGTSPAAQVKLKVFRLVAGNTYEAVGEDIPRTLEPNTLNTFTPDPGIDVQVGDLIGMNSFAGTPNCSFETPGETYLRTPATSDLANGESAAFTTAVANRRLNISAEIEPTAPPPPGPPPGVGPPAVGDPEPSNDFSFKVKKNKKKGTAKAKVKVPGPGDVELAKNKKVKGKDKSAEDEGTVNMPIKPKRKAKKRLKQKGKTKVKVKITYTPDGGEPNPKSKKTKLKKR